MNLKNKKYLYANGASLPAGGGFEPIQYRTEVREKYKEKGIDLPESQLECSYPYFLSQKLGLTCINESKSGSGVDRLIRTTFDWIFKNPDKIEDTLFILEPQLGIRLDWYVKEWNDYGILNAHLDEKGEYPFTLVKEWYVDDSMEREEWMQKYEKSITDFFNNFYEQDVVFRNDLKKLIFFTSFLNQKGIDYLIAIPFSGDWDLVEEMESIIPPNQIMNYILDNKETWEFCNSNKILISDEVDSDDNHIGFFGNQFLATKIAKFLLENDS